MTLYPTLKCVLSVDLHRVVMFTNALIRKQPKTLFIALFFFRNNDVLTVQVEVWKVLEKCKLVS